MKFKDVSEKRREEQDREMKVFVHDLQKRHTNLKGWESDLKVASPDVEMQMEGSRNTRVLLADDHVRVRMGLRSLLERTTDIIVVGEASDGVEALELAEKLEPDVLLLDMEMPRMNGTQVASRLKAKKSRIRILALSAHDDRQYILGMLNNGVSGYLTKEEAPDVLVKAVRGVARGEQGWVSKRVAEKIYSWNPNLNIDRSTFTPREREVLKLLKKRKTDPEIAEVLKISEQTVSRHIQMLCTKFQAVSRLELVVRAADIGLID